MVAEKIAGGKVLRYGAKTIPMGGYFAMPRLQGDNPYDGHEADPVRRGTLTHLQYGMLQQWAQPRGMFEPGGAPPPAADALHQTMFAVHALDRAATEQASGGAFYPGIEVSWQIRNRRLFSEPFRLDLDATSRYLDGNGLAEGTPLAAGHFSRQLALPWHADFNDCRSEGSWGWWPSQRPTEVFPDATSSSLSARVEWTRPGPGLKFPGQQGKTTHEQMVMYWAKFGFVVQQGDLFVEQERDLAIGV